MVLKDHNVEVTLCSLTTVITLPDFCYYLFIYLFIKSSHSCTYPLQVLSELLSDLEACDLQKGDTKVLANGEVAPGKFVVYQNING